MINTTNDPSTPPTQRSIGELVQSIRDELLGVVHHEIDIAKKEITAIAIKAGIIAACAAVLLFLLLSAWVMLLFAAATGLQALGLPYWGAFLIVAGGFIVVGAVAGLVAFLVSKRVTAPEAHIGTAQTARDEVHGPGPDPPGLPARPGRGTAHAPPERRLLRRHLRGALRQAGQLPQQLSGRSASGGRTEYVFPGPARIVPAGAVPWRA